MCEDEGLSRGLGVGLKGLRAAIEEHDSPMGLEVDVFKPGAANLLEEEFRRAKHGVDAVALVALDEGVGDVGLGANQGASGEEAIAIETAVEFVEDGDAIHKAVEAVEALEALDAAALQRQGVVIGADELKGRRDVAQATLGLVEHIPGFIEAQNKGVVVIGDHGSEGDAGADGGLDVEAALGAAEGAVFVIDIAQGAAAPDGHGHDGGDEVVDPGDDIFQRFRAIAPRCRIAVGSDEVRDPVDDGIAGIAALALEVGAATGAELEAPLTTGRAAQEFKDLGLNHEGTSTDRWRRRASKFFEFQELA